MNGNLLLVDDEVLLLKALKLNLMDYADNIYLAENGFQALEIIAKNEIHCVVCDINMPGMNGIDVIKKVRETHELLPFIFYTGHGNRELMVQASAFGAFDFLDKPNLDGLEEVVQNGLKRGLSGDQQLEKGGDSFSDYQALLKEMDQEK